MTALRKEPAHALPSEGHVEPGAPAVPLRLERLDAAALLALDPAAWDALARAALTENPFYARPYLTAGLRTIDRRARVRALAFFAPGDKLVGLLPYRHGSRVPAPFLAASAAANLYQFAGAPLVHRDHAAEVVGLWLDGVRDGTLRRLWAFNDIDVESPLAELILDGALARGLRVLNVNGYERAFLTRTAGGFAAHLGAALSKNRLKDVRRTLRRLDEAGTLVLEHADTPDRVRARLEDFLRLEHAGWKGLNGTALLSRPEHAEFARLACGGAEPFASFDTLLLDGAPIAMKLSIRTGAIAFTPKIAYDENYRKLGPGMALEYLLLERFYSTGSGPAAVDAAATAEGHTALDFFNGKKHMATLIVGARPFEVAVLARLHEARSNLKGVWKRAASALGQLRRRVGR